MGWFSFFFNFDNGRRAGKSQVFSSTHDAFSLPTSSPSLHPDAFHPPTPDPSTPTAFTYPPQGGYGFPSSRSGFASLLPTHVDPVHIRTPYPPLSKTWARIQNWLSREYPELGDTLNYGILPQDLAEIERQLGFDLPAVVRESYLCVDGQEAESSAGCSEGLFFGLKLLPLESVLEEWQFWREVDHDPTTGANPGLLDSMQSIPPNFIRKAYSQRGWIPLIADKAGNYVGIDLSPGEAGKVGQVIVFGRDFDTKVVLWRGDGPTGWAKWLANFVDELENGEGFEIGNNDGSEDSEDELGYEGYFYDGKGRGQGDGGGDTGCGAGLRLTGGYKGWNVLEAWADRSLRKWHQAGVITEADLVPIAESSSKQPSDLDIVDSQGSSTEVHIPALSYSQEKIPTPPHEVRKQYFQRSQSTVSPKTRESVPTIAITKPPAPLPVDLPTSHDIAPLPSPPESDDDLEAGRGHEVELSSSTIGKGDDIEIIGLVTSTRRIGKSRSPVREETSDATDSALPLPLTPRPSNDLATPTSTILPRQNPTASRSVTMMPIVAPVPRLAASAPNLPDLLEDETTPVMNVAPPLEPSVSSSSSHGKQKEKLEVSPTTNPHDKEDVTRRKDTEPDTTIRLVGGGGQSGMSHSPVTVTADEATEDEAATPPPPLAQQEVNSAGGAAVSVADLSAMSSVKKGHKKPKGSLATLKRFSVGALSKKKDSISSTKDVASSR